MSAHEVSPTVNSNCPDATYVICVCGWLCIAPIAPSLKWFSTHIISSAYAMILRSTPSPQGSASISFEHRQGSVYCSIEKMSAHEVYDLVDELNASCPWLRNCLRYNTISPKLEKPSSSSLPINNPLSFFFVIPFFLATFDDWFPRAMSQAYAKQTFGECREGQQPR